MTAKLIYGVGYNSKTKYPTSENGRISTAYSQWYAMIWRCYDIKRSKKNKSYIDCDVSSEWHDFQKFADWFYDNPYSNLGYQLDKDLLFPNNKIYSPDACCFVPQELNSLLTDRRSARGDLPQGVDIPKSSSKFRAKIRMGGKQERLGYFDCPNEAHQVYKKAKEAHVKEKALEWQDRIADNVFQALMNWTLDS